MPTHRAHPSRVSLLKGRLAASLHITHETSMDEARMTAKRTRHAPLQFLMTPSEAQSHMKNLALESIA